MKSATTTRVLLTAGRVGSFKCPPDKSQAFLWDSKTPTLALRATPTGRKTYVFESRLRGKTLRVQIGSYPEWSLDDARRKAENLKRLVDDGKDPREIAREQEAESAAAKVAAEVAKVAAAAEAAASAITVHDAWAAYVHERTPNWGDLHRRDHENKASPGGKDAKRGTRGNGKTRPGPLFPLMALPLRSLNAATIEAWASNEAKTRPSSARLAWRLLKVFLTWCAEQPAYAQLLPPKNPAKTTKTRESLGKAGAKSDVLQRGQLAEWFKAVRQIPNRTIAAALQVMLLTGARPGEVLALRWEDVDTQWGGLTFRDKVEGLRVIPLTAYVAHLLASLPRANDFVFASARWVTPIKDNHGHWVDTSKSGHIAEPNTAHTKACAVAGLTGLTLHGLRRSFKSLTEWLEIPAGVVAQIMGHKPSATAEKHYTVRPLELLALHHERIEEWILEQAVVTFAKTPTTSTKLRTIATY